MARLFSPSGETEFFEITELQAGFEKELKTGERVTISPGAREASFLREAPIRAELSQLYEQFRDRVLNPPDPFQPPASYVLCPTWVGKPDGKFESGIASGVSASPNPPEIHVTLNQNQLGLAQWAGQTAITTGVVSGGNFSFPAIPWSASLSPLPQNLANSNFYGPNAYLGPTLPPVLGAFSATIGVAWWNPTGVPAIQNMQLGVEYQDFAIWQPSDPIANANYLTPVFSCNNIPANNSPAPIPIATVTADFQRFQYSCLPVLSNFVFTNLYP